MFRIRQVHDAVTTQNQLAISAVLRIYEEAFSYDPQYAAKIAQILQFTSDKDSDVILLVAEGQKNRSLGFALSFHFTRQRYGFLDYLISHPRRNARGYGGALYEAACEWLLQRKAKGLFMDVPPDDVDLLIEKKRLGVNKRRLGFYERFGARPVINTAYETTTHRANVGHGTYLVYDDLDTGKPLTRKDLRAFVK